MAEVRDWQRKLSWKVYGWNRHYKCRGKHKERNRLSTLSSDLYPSQLQCGKAHLIPFGRRSKERRALEKDRIGGTQTIPRRGERRRIDDNNKSVVKKMDVVQGALTLILVSCCDIEKFGQDWEKVLGSVIHFLWGYSFCTISVHTTWIVIAVTLILVWRECLILPSLFSSS